MQPREIAIILLIFLFGTAIILSGCGEIQLDTESVERELDETQTSAEDLEQEIEKLRQSIEELEEALEKGC